MDESVSKPTFREALIFWLKLGCISFGGPAGQIALMQRELVDRRKWIGERTFLQALNFCFLLPGPEAQQLATYCGWLMHGVRGGLVAGLLFVLPSAVLLWLLSWFYVEFGTLAWVSAVFDGLQSAVLAIVVGAVWRIGRRVLRTPVMWGLAVGAFTVLFFGMVTFPWVVVGAAGFGWMAARCGWVGLGAADVEAAGVGGSLAGAGRVALFRAVLVLAAGLVLWWLPVAVSAWGLGYEHAVTQQGFFFSKVAVVTFGGAYAVLPYVSQQAVGHFGWLTQAQMMDGLALAETTPGPLVMVLSFVGFIGGWQHPGLLPPLVAATLGSVLTLWTTFVPSFLWIFLGAPVMERLRQVAWLRVVLAAVTAAVVGVILNLAAWLAASVVWWPETGAVNWFGVGLAAAALTALNGLKWNVVTVIGASAVAGMIWWAVAL
jgi:chromate transporter